MSRNCFEEIRPSIFTSRNNSLVQRMDKSQYVEIGIGEYLNHGYTVINGKRFILNSIIAMETGEYIRRPTIQTSDCSHD